MANKNYRLYGFLLYYILKIVSKTMRKKIIKSKEIEADESYIYAFWHNKLIAASVTLTFVEKKAVLASPSKDGELISVPLEKLGFTVVRGSSGKDSAKSLINLIRLVKNGYSAGTPLDGPKGPMYEVKHGMLYLAQKLGKKIIPVGAAFSNKWTFEKAWDKFQFPKPFSKLVCILGDPIEIPPDCELDEYADIVRDELLNLDRQAERELGNK